MTRLSVIVFLVVFITFLVGSFAISIMMDIRCRDKKKFFVKLALVIAFIVSISIWNNSFSASSLPNIGKSDYNKNYIMDLKYTKESTSGTKVRVNKAFMDLGYISINLGIKGKDKLVAIEIKKNLEDEKPLKSMDGLWIGNGLSYEHNGFGMPYNEEEFLSTIYLVCHLSNGEDLNFQLNDLKGVKENTELIKLNETLEHEGRKITITNFTRAINYTTVSAKSEGRFWDMEVSLILNGEEIEKSTNHWSGGGNSYDYGVNFKPVEDGELTLKFYMKNSGKEYFVKVKDTLP